MKYNPFEGSGNSNSRPQNWTLVLKNNAIVIRLNRNNFSGLWEDLRRLHIRGWCGTYRCK